MSSVRSEGPRVHCIRRVPVVTEVKEEDILELVLQELGIGCADKTKRRYRTHCLNPDLMTRTTVIALDVLGCKLKQQGARYYRLRIDEIRRLIWAAPYQVKRELKLHSLI